jgi:hypothetical protein
MIQPAAAVVAAIGSIGINLKELDNSVVEGVLSPHSMKNKSLIGRNTSPKRSVFSNDMPKNSGMKKRVRNSQYINNT